MTFQSSVLRDGEWVTEVVDINNLLRNQSSNRSSTRISAPEPPVFGILTRTVIESPVAHWILSARLRSADHTDIACVGDSYVQISELGSDGRLRVIVRKTDFGPRIRNAVVIGSPHRRSCDDEPEIKAEKDDSNRFMDVEERHASAPSDASLGLPPQQLLVVLESGDCVFLFVRQTRTGGYDVVSNVYRPHGQRYVYPGYHAAVDPYSRYLALACAEGLFVVYRLESPQTMTARYVRNEPIKPIKASRPRAVHGIIHKMEFLYPNPDDDYHVILLLLIHRNGVSRMVTYDWEVDDDLASVLATEKKGHPLPPEHQMPLLVVPLTVQTAFFTISSDRIGVCKNALHMPAEFYDFKIDALEIPLLNNGDTQTPALWTAWTRPYRLPTYSTKRDNIYLAREDGMIMFLDIDSDNILGATVEIGKFDCNIGRAFCSLIDQFNDILIMGGECGPGIISQVRARKPNVTLGSIPNWSPVVDFVTNDEFAVCNGLVGANANEMVVWDKQKPTMFIQPDQIFATSGRGATGCITEFRHGLRACIGLDIDYESPVQQAWIFNIQSNGSDLGFHMLIALFNTSVVLHLSSDLVEASQLEEAATPYDQASRSVAAMQLENGAVVQVTEHSVVYASVSQRALHRFADIFDEPQTTIVDACIQWDLIAVSATVQTKFSIHLLRFSTDSSIQVVKSFDPICDVTCICLTVVSGSPCIAAGLVGTDGPAVALFQDVGAPPTVTSLNSEAFLKLTKREDTLFEAPSSVTQVPHDGDTIVLAVGTRGGELLTLSVDKSGAPCTVHLEKVGLTAVQAQFVDDSSAHKSVLIFCEGRISLQSNFDLQRLKFRSMHMVWGIDVTDASKRCPAISGVSYLSRAMPGHPGKTHLLMCSSSRIMIAELDEMPGPVPHNLPVGGTPVKVIYSHLLKCLIVAIKDKKGKATLRFVDTDTGEDLSYPVGRNSELVEYVSGLGKPDDQILGLNEWHYVRDGDKWVFLLVATIGGRLLVISAVRVLADDDGRTTGPHRKTKVKYWTRSRRVKFSEPVYSVVGWNSNVFYCVGSTLYWDQLDVAEKRLRTLGTFQLCSPATSLRIVNGKVAAVTEHDSLVIIDISSGAAGEMALHHADAHWRAASHAIEIGSVVNNGELKTSLMLTSDRAGSVAGLWIPWHQEGRDCRVIFEADLPASIRKLVRGRTRPGWQQMQRRVQYGQVPSTPDAAEILGVCIDGSMQHFTLLNAAIWRVLRMVQNLALQTPTRETLLMRVSTRDGVVEGEPLLGTSDEMHVDGNVLQRVLDERSLKSLFKTKAQVSKMAVFLGALGRSQMAAEFWNSGWPKTAAAEEENVNDELEVSADIKDKCIAILYDILEYYLAPVF